jgi:hypothetical protein
LGFNLIGPPAYGRCAWRNIRGARHYGQPGHVGFAPAIPTGASLHAKVLHRSASKSHFAGDAECLAVIAYCVDGAVLGFLREHDYRAVIRVKLLMDQGFRFRSQFVRL